MNNFDLMKYVSKGAVGFGLYTLYDGLVEGIGFNEISYKDGLTFALSSVAAEWTADLISGFLSVNENSISFMISRPLLTGIIYMYLYNYMLREEYEGGRDNMRNIVMGALAEVLLGYVANPIASLFGNYRNL